MFSLSLSPPPPPSFPNEKSCFLSSTTGILPLQLWSSEALKQYTAAVCACGQFIAISFNPLKQVTHLINGLHQICCVWFFFFVFFCHFFYRTYFNQREILPLFMSPVVLFWRSREAIFQTAELGFWKENKTKKKDDKPGEKRQFVAASTP